MDVSQVVVNGVLPRGHTHPSEIPAFVRTSPFCTLKLKVGGRAVYDDAAAVRAAAAACTATGKTLRLDANRTWTVAQYRAFVAVLLKPIPISTATSTTPISCLDCVEYIEEPVSFIDDLAHVLDDEHSIPVALDESLDEIDVQRVLPPLATRLSLIHI